MTTSYLSNVKYCSRVDITSNLPRGISCLGRSYYRIIEGCYGPKTNNEVIIYNAAKIYIRYNIKLALI